MHKVSLAAKEMREALYWLGLVARTEPSATDVASALRKEGQGTAVWVLDKSTMTLASRPVQVASADGNDAVIAAGLQPGMLVVAAGVHVLSSGQKVAIYQERTAQSTATAQQDAARNMASAAGSAHAATLPAVR